jgi:hypothetical protein
VVSSDEISFPKRKLSQKIYDDMWVTLGDKYPSCSTVKNWVARLEQDISALKTKNVLGD